jgi:glycosyltransferase involved in cell wall biosynthesis
VRAAHDLPAGAQVVAVVARLEARKGHRDLLTAISLLPGAVRAGLVTVIAGDGPERDALEKIAAELGLASQVRFLGDHPDPWSLYQVADLVVLPSIGQEDLPIVLIEAMAAGRPVVATEVAGAVELVDDGATGLLVPPGRPDALARAIGGLLADPGRRAAMGAAAVARYQATYTPDRVTARYRQLYADLLAEVAP